MHLIFYPSCLTYMASHFILRLVRCTIRLEVIFFRHTQIGLKVSWLGGGFRVEELPFWLSGTEDTA